MGVSGLYRKFIYFVFVAGCLLAAGNVYSQQQQDSLRLDSILNTLQQPILGPNDTITVSAKISEGTLIPARTLENVWVTKPAPPGMRQRIEAWTRLRNAVYVTYP